MPATLLVSCAHDVARDLLAAAPHRWAHARAVGLRSEEIAASARLPDRDAEALVAAGWLHDIGHHPQVRSAGFHPLDGALHLRREGWPEEVVQLVAHHSGARFVADVHGLGEELAQVGYPDERLLDLVSYADQTIGPGGMRVRVEDRIADTLHRHGPGSPNARAHARRGPYLVAMAARVRTLLRGTPPSPRH